MATIGDLDESWRLREFVFQKQRTQQEMDTRAGNTVGDRLHPRAPLNTQHTCQQNTGQTHTTSSPTLALLHRDIHTQRSIKNTTPHSYIKHTPNTHQSKLHQHCFAHKANTPRSKLIATSHHKKISQTDSIQWDMTTLLRQPQTILTKQTSRHTQKTHCLLMRPSAPQKYSTHSHHKLAYIHTTNAHTHNQTLATNQSTHKPYKAPFLATIIKQSTIQLTTSKNTQTTYIHQKNAENSHVNS